MITIGTLIELFGTVRNLSWAGLSSWLAAGMGLVIVIVPVAAGIIGAALYKADRLIGFVTLCWIAAVLMMLGSRAKVSSFTTYE
jgi:hypothetical protein